MNAQKALCEKKSRRGARAQKAPINGSKTLKHVLRKLCNKFSLAYSNSIQFASKNFVILWKFNVLRC